VDANLSLVQETVRNQCQIPDYVADGSWDSSSYPLPYYDILEERELRIDCDLKDEKWECSCTARD
jgi:hypothetical protein